MRRTTRLSALVPIIGALLLPASAAVAGPAGGDPLPGPAANAATIAWAPCPNDDTAECGTLTVPVDWDSPDGATFDLALARRKATDPAARIGSLVINPGGPGGSGVAFALRRTSHFSAEITRRFDIVGFDPRGVGRSNPVMCSTQLLAEGPRETPTNQAEFDRLKEYNARLGADCRARTGPVFDHVDTLSVVRDIDAIRQAVGDRALSFYGLSYGTLMGQQYAEQFPDRVRALVLDSNMDHSLGTAEFLESQAATAQDSFDEFVAGCARDKQCAMHGLDVRAIWADLLERARRGTLHEPGEASAPISEIALINMAFGSFYRPIWWELAANIKRLHASLPSRVAMSGAGPAGAPGALAGGAAWQRAAGGGGPVPQASAYSFGAVFCQDWSLPVRDYPELAGHVARMATVAPSVPYSPLALQAVTGCLGWPSKVNNPQHPLRVAANAAPLLMVNAAHDPATGYQWAANAASQLGPRATLVTYEGWGHTVYGRERCSTDLMDRYLVQLTLPAPGTRCAAAPVQSAAQRAPGTARPLPAGPRQGLPGWS